MSIKVSVDRSVDAAYITLSDEPIVKTVEVTPAILVDLDAMNMVVGIEALSIDADLPLQRLKDEFHVHSANIDLLNKLRPSIGYQLTRFQQTTDGTSARSGVDQPA